jgi:predicted GIY-YIG superfamily endonuclease
MQTPVPTEKDVEEFRRIFEERFQACLRPEEAHEAARRVLAVYFLMHYALPAEREAQQEEHRVKRKKRQRKREAMRGQTVMIPHED